MGVALIGVTGGAAVALSVIAAPFVTPALRKVAIMITTLYATIIFGLIDTCICYSCLSINDISLVSNNNYLITKVNQAPSTYVVL